MTICFSRHKKHPFREFLDNSIAYLRKKTIFCEEKGNIFYLHLEFLGEIMYNIFAEIVLT